MPLDELPTYTSKGTRRLRTGRALRTQIIPRIVLVALGAFYFLPLYWLVVNALKSNSELNVYPPTWYPHNLEWSNFSRAVDVFPF